MNNDYTQCIAKLIVFHILNETRDYYGLDTRVSNEFVNELIEYVSDILKKNCEHKL